MNVARSIRKPWVLVGVGLGGIVVALGVAAFSYESILRWFVVRAARSHGVDLVVDHVDPGWGWIRLRGVRVAFDGLDSVHATIDRATLELRGLSPSRVEARGVDVAIVGSAADVAVDVSTWATQQSEALQVPIVAEGVHVAWTERTGQAPWLEVATAIITPVTDGCRLKAETATVLGVKIGPVGATWTSDRATAALGFGRPEIEAAIVRIEVPHGKGTGPARMTLAPVRLADLEKPLGVLLPIKGEAIVQGTAEVMLRPEKDGDLEGKLHLQVTGYVPPHPKELDGIVFGNVTTFDTQLSLKPDRKHLQLTNAVVAAGAFKLAGGGTIARQGTYALIDLNFAGSIPCSAVVKSASGAHLPGLLGDIVGDVVGGMVKGSVRVAVGIKADTRDLAAAEVKPTVGVGCGLKLP